MVMEGEVFLQMKLSQYNIYVPYKAGTIVYNSLTYRLGFIEGDLNPCLENNISSTFGGILVDENTDEIAQMRKHLETRFDDDMYRIEIMITQRCNLACSYCYQQTKAFRRFDMPASIVDESIAFINSLEKPKTITFYGGEPLLRIDLIERICQKTNNVTKFSIITNGIGLTVERAKRLVELGVTDCQITLDGNKKDHDATRKDIYGTGTHDTILQNIMNALSTGLKITVRTNVGNQSKKDLQAFYLSFLKDDLYKRLKFSISDIIGGPSDRHEIICSLFSRLLALGYDINCPITIPCQISGCKSLVIDGEGYIYPCMYFAGVDRSKAIGHVSGGIKEEKTNIYKEIKPWEECLACNFVGVCAGGCQIRAATLNKKYCQKPFLEAVLHAEIKQAYFLQTERKR